MDHVITWASNVIGYFSIMKDEWVRLPTTKERMITCVPLDEHSIYSNRNYPIIDYD